MIKLLAFWLAWRPARAIAAGAAIAAPAAVTSQAVFRGSGTAPSLSSDSWSTRLTERSSDERA